MSRTFLDKNTAEQHFLHSDAPCNPSADRCGTEQHPPAEHNLWLPPDNAHTLLQQMDQWACFAVLALQIDPPAAENPSDTLRTAIEEYLQQAIESHGGRWFIWHGSRYGCVIPETNGAIARTLARQLRTELAAKMIETVSVGIFTFPILDFDRRQSFANALKALEHAAFFGTDSCVEFDSVTLTVSGDLYFQLHDLESAIGEYRLALRLDENNSTARNSLGVCLVEKGEQAAAMAEFTAVLDRAPADAMALYNIGLIHLLDNDSAQALTFFKRADQAAPETPEIAFQIGKLLTMQNQWQAAVPYFETVVRLQSDSAAAFNLLGQCREASGDIAKAVAAYQKAVKLNPNDAAALSSLGELYAAIGENIEICLTFSRQSVLIEPDNGLFHLRLGRLLQQDRQWEAALSEYKQAATFGHPDPEAEEKVRERLQNAEPAADASSVGLG